MENVFISSSQYLTLLTDFRKFRLAEYFKNTGSCLSNLLFEAKYNDNDWLKKEIDKYVSDSYKSINEPKFTDYQIIYSM